MTMEALCLLLPVGKAGDFRSGDHLPAGTTSAVISHDPQPTRCLLLTSRGENLLYPCVAIATGNIAFLAVNRIPLA